MRSFEPGSVEAMPIRLQPLRIVREIGECKGQQDLFQGQPPQVLESLRQVALIQSTEPSNRIESVTAPAERIRSLVARKTTAQNRAEQEIAGYRDVPSTDSCERAQHCVDHPCGAPASPRPVPVPAGERPAL